MKFIRSKFSGTSTTTIFIIPPNERNHNIFLSLTGLEAIERQRKITAAQAELQRAYIQFHTFSALPENSANQRDFKQRMMKNAHTILTANVEIYNECLRSPNQA